MYTPSSAILAARRALEGISEVIILRDWTWNEPIQQWVLHCRLTPGFKGTEAVPSSTDWYVVVSPQYPWGSIIFYPAEENGITATFPHQSFNAMGSDELPWRTGNICLDTEIHILDRSGGNQEQPRDIDSRLKWYFQRALTWLRAASEGSLLTIGDPYELPALPRLTVNTLGFSESSGSLGLWQEITEVVGLVELATLREHPILLCVKNFQSIQGRVLLDLAWGRLVHEVDNASWTRKGIWLQLQEVPLFQDWQLPTTWGELRKVCRRQGIELDALLKMTLPRIRNQELSIVLLGFPIPALVGGPCQQMHWLAVQLPTLSGGKRTAKGFRPKEHGYWHRDRYQLLTNDQPLQWLSSENWHQKEITTRGRLAKEITERKILMVGAGALGSVVAELLTRGSIYDLTIIDQDILGIGNLVRHPLEILNLGKFKASEVAARCNRSSPHANVKYINSQFPPTQEKAHQLIQECEVVLDCTGSDEALYQLQCYSWNGTKTFISLSLGQHARRLFCFADRGSSFPFESFSKVIALWLEREHQEFIGQDFLQEGIGCWHPVFPARVDDIWLMASIAVKYMETILASSITKPTLTVFEQNRHNDNFIGVSMTEESSCA